ncbi:hypothetical protein MTO96_003775 [Rhipicephalus appendiculatus]
MSLCDYTIYDGFVFHNAMYSPYGDPHLKVFMNAFTGQQRTIPGLSFSSDRASDPNGTAQQIVQDTKLTHISSYVTQPPHFIAMGFLNVKFASAKVSTFLPAMKMLYTAISGSPKHLLFFGAYIYSTRSGARLAREVQTIPNIGLVVLQTHITPTIGIRSKRCKTNLIGYNIGQGVRDAPSYTVANTTIGRFRSFKNSLKVLLSSSMGVMVYVAKKGAVYGDKNWTRQGCTRGFLTDHDFLCSEVNAQASSVNTKEYAHYQIYSQHNRYHFATWEEIDTMRLKVAAYINSVDGWALFNADLDERRICETDKNFELVRAFYMATRTGQAP